MSDPTYTTTSIDAIADTDPILIGDRVRVTGSRDYVLLPQVFSGSPDEEALDFAKKVQLELAAQHVVTIRRAYEGSEVTTGTYRFVVELEVIDITDARGQSTISGQDPPEVGVDRDANQIVISGSIKLGSATLQEWHVVVLALAAATASVVLYNWTAAVERVVLPGVEPMPYIDPFGDVKEIFQAAAVFMIFYFAYKVAR